MRISPHLVFDGQCRAAFSMYQHLFEGALSTLLTYGDSPLAAQIDPRWHERIVHASLRLGEFELTGVDAFPQDYRRPQGFFVTMTLDSPTRAERISNALAAEG